MRFTRNRIKKDVRICLDENSDNSALLGQGDVDTLMLDEIIESNILEAVRRVHLQAPPLMLESGHNITGDIVWDSSEPWGYILLPDDFLRLVVFEMSDWERPVYNAITATHPLYKQQRSRFKGVRGNPQRPVVALLNQGDSVYLTKDSIGLRLEFYSCKSRVATVKRAVYIPEPSVDTTTDSIDISELCYKAVVYMAAALVCSVFGETEKSNQFTGLSNSYLQHVHQ